MKKIVLPSKKIVNNIIRTVVLIFGVLIYFSGNTFGQVIMSSNGSYSQNFDGLSNSGTLNEWSDNLTIVNWYAQRSGTGKVYAADDGKSNSGNLYSYGSSGSTERALGSLGSGNAAAGNFAYGVLLQNKSGSTITDIKVSYTLEQWRNSGVTTSQGDTFYYKIASTPITTLNPNANTGWTMVTELIANSPVNIPVPAGSTPALDGNATDNRVVLTNVKIPGLSLANDEYILLKWDDRDNLGADHGLAIDDVTIAWTVSSTPPPTVPAASTITSITPGNGQLSVAFTAGADGGAAITNYQYSTDGGQNWVASSPAQTISPIVITGLTNGTTYNVQIRAVNSVGSGAASATVSGTPVAPATPSLTASTISSFGNVCVNNTSGTNSFTISGVALIAGDITVGPLTGYTFSNISNGTYANTLTISNPTGGTLTSTTVFVKFNPTAIQSYNGNIPVSGGGATAINVAVFGAGINTSASATTGTSSGITSLGATLSGSYTEGCSSVTSYGIEYSTTDGFTPGSGTKSVSTNQTAGSYSTTLSGLTASTIYYYVAYVTTSSGPVYGTQASFTTATVGPQPASVIAAWDFTGSSSIATLAATTFNSNLVSTNSLNEITRGLGAAASSGANSFRTTGFKNDGISTDNTDYFQTTLQTAAGYSLSLSSINAKFAGTASFYATPGVTSQFAYSLDGNNFTLIGTPLTSNLLTFSADVSGVADLQNIPSGTTVYIRYYASGQTATGGWGFNSPSAGSNGLEYTGFVKIEVVSPRIVANPKSLSFGNICNNNTSSPNSFSISGVALAAGNITVGPLTGYSFSSTSAGTYTNTLNISQPGGALAPTTVFVKFNPTAIQSYNGNIPVSGGGAASINVAATGSGSAVVTPTFTQPASICAGSSYSLPLTSTNGISGTWSPAFDNATTKEYTFTPGVSQCAVETKLTVTVNPKVTPSFTQVAPICLGGSFDLPTTSENGIPGTWAPSRDFTQTQPYTFTPAAGECASVAIMTVVVNISGAEIVTGDSTSITRNSVVLSGTINTEGCSPITEYGIEYSPINAFINGTGKQVPSSNLNSNKSFSSQVNGLVQNTAYYYKAYAKSANGIVYGEPKLFFTKPIAAGLTIYGSPILRGTPLRYSLSGIKQGYYAARIFDLNGRLVYKKEIINQLNFIDDSFILPSSLPPGEYNLQIFCPDFKINKKFLAL